MASGPLGGGRAWLSDAHVRDLPLINACFNANTERARRNHEFGLILIECSLPLATQHARTLRVQNGRIATSHPHV
jgi:hypothetical protein